MKPPQYLVELGLEEADIYWKLNRAMYGLRKAPKKWEETRNAGLKTLVIEPNEEGENPLSLLQCTEAKNIWKIQELQDGGSHKVIGNNINAR